MISLSYHFTVYNIFKLLSSRDDFDPRVTNEFAAAAFRVGHTLIPDIITTFTEITGKAQNHIRLTQAFGDGDILRQANFFDELLRGMTIQQSEDYDNNFVPSISNELFDEGPFALDLIAINIQRGRDHGLPGYIDYRESCGGEQITKFDQLGPNIVKEVCEFRAIGSKAIEMDIILLIMDIKKYFYLSFALQMLTDKRQTN